MLPKIHPRELNVQPVDMTGLPLRFLNLSEIEIIVALMRLVPNPALALEIGCHEGRTARVALREIPSLKHYVGVDVEWGYKPVLPVQKNEVPLRPGHYVLDDDRFDLMLSRNGSLDLGPADIGPADIVFIDGDHSRRVVEHDSALARAIIQPGGIIIWHDYHELGTVDVPAVLNEYHAAGHPIVHVDGTWLAFERH